MSLRRKGKLKKGWLSANSGHAKYSKTKRRSPNHAITTSRASCELLREVRDDGRRVSMGRVLVASADEAWAIPRA
jgi:hypothetical protein